MQPRHTFHLALQLSVLTGIAMAQSPAPWTILPVPGGVNPNGIRQIGKVVTYTENTQVHAYSAFSHRFVAVPVGAPPAVRVGNDLALAVDGNNYHAFAAYTGSWATITLGPAATVVNPAGQQNDSIWLVRDGNDLWAFTAFRGAWHRLVVGAGASAQVERHVALVIDGTTLHALSAFESAWVTTTAPAIPTASRSRGTAAVAASGAGIHGFSALANAWAAWPSPGPNPALAVNDDVQVISAGGTYVAFSGLRGSFAQQAIPTAALTLGETVCYATDGSTQHFAYSAVRGTWTTLPAATTPTVAVSSNAVVLGLLDRVHAFSAMTGTVATAMTAPAVTLLSRSVASLLAQDSSIKFFSAIRGQWYDAPAGSSSAEISDVAGFVRTATGIAAFSSRSGRFTPLVVSPAATTIIAIGNAVQAAIDNNVLHVFDPRRERWLSGALHGTPQIGTHRTTLLVVDGTQAYGYGSFSGRLAQIPLPGPGTIVRPNSESGSLELQNAIYAHSSAPDLLTLFQYPEFRRVYTTGTPLELQIQASSGTGYVFLGLRALPAPTPFLGLGELELDPAQIILIPGLAVAIAQNHGVLRFPVPDAPGLRGLELSFQAVVLPTVGSPYLTQSTSVSMF